MDEKLAKFEGPNAKLDTLIYEDPEKTSDRYERYLANLIYRNITIPNQIESPLLQMVNDWNIGHYRFSFFNNQTKLEQSLQNPMHYYFAHNNNGYTHQLSKIVYNE